MRMIVAALGLMVAAGAALAETDGFTPAPVPEIGPAGVPPAERAGVVNGAQTGAPLSGLPNTLSAGSGTPTPAFLSGPNPETAPSPDLSR